jgi:hypothetical protein
MPTYVINDILEVQCIGYGANYSAMNVVHFRVKATPPTDVALLSEIYGTLGFLHHLGPVVSSQYYFSQLKHRRVRPQPLTEYISTSHGNVPGRNLNAAGIPQGAAMVAIKTALDARAGRGRIFAPALPGASYANGVWSIGMLGSITNLQDGMTPKFKVGGTSTYLELGVYSLQTTPGTWNGMTSVLVRSEPGVRRTRRPHGPN